MAGIHQAEAASLEQSQINNFGRWPMQGIEVWPNTKRQEAMRAKSNIYELAEFADCVA